LRKVASAGVVEVQSRNQKSAPAKELDMARRRKAKKRRAEPAEDKLELPPVYEVEVLPIERRLFPRGRRGELVDEPVGTLPAFERRRSTGRRAEDWSKKPGKSKKR
jgi:hypothetical protein